ncbi:MAG: hypothetical protein QXH37_02425, partial [Candidatus Bathyarchaeia archaeon]
ACQRIPLTSSILWKCIRASNIISSKGKTLTKVKVLSVLLAASLFLAAFLGYSNYALQAENLRLKSELQSKYDELFDNYNLLNQSYHRLSLEYVSLNQTFYTLMQDFRKLSSDYEEALASYLNLSVTYTMLNQKYILLLQNYTALSEEYKKVLVDYVDLAVAYETLNQTYYELLQNYTRLERETAGYTTLLSEYQGLTQLYQSLQVNYTQLKEKYDAFYVTLYDPLLSKDKVVPKKEELKQWLAEDKTNEINYTDPDFVCGDYAVMLHMHAKLKGWDMGVIGVLGRLTGGREFNHAFNAIICKEGLVYVEPQNDEVFDGPIEDEYYHPGFGRVQVEELIVVVLYDSV